MTMMPNTRRLLIKANSRQPKPVRLDVLEASTKLPGKSTQLLVGLLLLVAIRQAPTIPLSRRTMARVNVSRYCATDALRRLEQADISLAGSYPAGRR